MKLGVWGALVFVITFALVFLIKVEFWIFIIVVLPLLIIVLTSVSAAYNFRDSIKPQPIPQSGYQSRIRELDRDADTLQALGFKKFDQFYLKAIPDSVTYAFKHESEPTIFCVYHLGKKTTCDFFTRYDNDYALTTSNVVDAGMSPRPSQKLLQIFPDSSYREIYFQHQRSHEFLMQQGLRSHDLPEAEFRRYFMESYHESGKYMTKSLIWPVVLVIRVISQYGRKYCRSVIDQIGDGTIQLFSRKH